MSSMHYSVLLKDSVEALVQNADGIYVDGTFGRGGHSREILSRLSSSGKLIAFDKDPQAVSVGATLHEQDARFEMVHASFASLPDYCKQQGVLVDGILLDLGVSSPQLDQAERGFSFLRDGPLDMRMDYTRGLSAADWIDQVDERDMAKVFKEYGEERFARRIARKIIERRQEGKISRTLELAKLIEDAVPKKEIGKHPATRVFQAIRIEVNSELDELANVLESSLDVLNENARLVVISFHSLEDRLVKRFFRKYSKSQDFPQGVPVTHDMLRAPLAIVGKAVKASDGELQENVRSRSAILRVAKKTKWR